MLPLWSIGAVALAGAYDTTEVVVLGQPAAISLRWRAEPVWDDLSLDRARSCLVTVTVADDQAAFNTASCTDGDRPMVERVLETTAAEPLEELGWGLKTWTRVWVEIVPQADAVAVTLRPGGSGDVVELHWSQVRSRELVGPIYPPDASWRRVEGDCALHVRVDPKGRPTQVAPLRCTEGFAAAAVTAMQESRFKPHRVAGEAVEFDAVLTLQFRLDPPTTDQDGSP